MTPPRPTVRSLAAEAGVSPMTVSLALRDSPSVSDTTRIRIQKLAELRGYRPDPAINKLMYHLRARRPQRFQASICGLAERWPSGARDRHFFSERLLIGLRARADTLGYAFSVVYFDEVSGSRPLQHMLLSRGIEGLVILPLLRPRTLDGLLDWSAFSTLSVTSSLVAPHFHTVIPYHFDNMLLACQQLTAAGYQRIGLVLPKDWDLRVNHRWVGAITWQNQYGGTTPVRPFIGERHGLDLDTGAIKAWVAEQKPDVIISDDIGQSSLHEALQAVPVRRRPHLATLNWSPHHAEAGIDQQVEEIGATAINVLAGMIVHNEKGIPAVPHTTMVLGHWVPGNLKGRRKPVAAAPPAPG